MKISIVLGVFLATLVVYARGQTCGCDDPLRAATYNTMQTPGTPNRDVRLVQTIKYFDTLGSNFDLVCFNDLWEAGSADALLDGIRDQYPFAVTSSRTRDSTCATTPVCTPTEIETLLGCTNNHECVKATDGTSLFGCVIENCDGEIKNLTAVCRDCINNNSSNTFDGALKACGGLEEVSPDVETSCQFLFDGRSDNVLVSKYEFTDSAQLFYNVTPFVAWGAVYGRIVHPVFGPIYAFCTHLVPAQPFGDFSQENADQTQELLRWISDIVPAGTNDTVLIMGDFSSGPQVDDNEAILDANYRLVLNAGYSDSTIIFAQNNNQEVNCTFCEENPLNDNGFFGTRDRDFDIDHIFVNEAADLCVADSDRFLTERIVTLEDPGDDDELEAELVPPSDHYAVRSAFCRSSGAIGPSDQTPGGTSMASAKYVSGAVIMALLFALIAF